MTGKCPWIRVSRRHPCPVCGRGDWCLIAPDGSAAICPRISEDATKHLPGSGYLHRLQSDHWQRPYIQPVKLPVPIHGMPVDFLELSSQYERVAGDSHVEQLARSLSVSGESLRRLHVGWDGRAFTFPMRDGNGRIIGVRRRLRGGRKLCVTGSRNGVFIPNGLGSDDALFIAEGESDTSALLTLGFPAIGRPSCTGGAAYALQFARGRDVVIVADADDSGRCGAISLAGELRAVCPSVRIIIPPSQIDGLPVKDARAWLQAGATHRDIDVTLKRGPIARSAKVCDRAEGVTFRAT